MKSAILKAPGELEIIDVPIPEPGPGEVVIKVRAALTCGTDIKAFLRGHPKIPLPSPMGHEFAGDVYAVGEGVLGLPERTPVMAVHSAPCGECPFCRMRRENLCERVMEDKVLGAYAEYLKLPARVVSRNLFRIPEGISYAEAAMMEPLSCVVHGLDLARTEGIATVLVIGPGPIGLLHLLLNKSRGRKVIVAGRNRSRLQKARELGADVVLDVSAEDIAQAVLDATDGLGADLVVEATGNREVWEAAPSLARRGGTVLLFGGCPSGTTISFDAARLHYDEITLMGAFHFTPTDVKEAYKQITERRIEVSGLISGEYPLSELRTAFDELIAGRGIKYAVIP